MFLNEAFIGWVDYVDLQFHDSFPLALMLLRKNR
jgi:hypothetical protein